MGENTFWYQFIFGSILIILTAFAGIFLPQMEKKDGSWKIRYAYKVAAPVINVMTLFYAVGSALIIHFNSNSWVAEGPWYFTAFFTGLYYIITLGCFFVADMGALIISSRYSARIFLFRKMKIKNQRIRESKASIEDLHRETEVSIKLLDEWCQ